MLAMVARLAEALILALWQCQALCLVLARLLVARVALGQDLVAHSAAAREVRRGCRQDQLILHILRLGTACNARLHIVQLDPVREPFQRAVTVKWIAAKCTRGWENERGVSRSFNKALVGYQCYSHVCQRLEILEGPFR